MFPVTLDGMIAVYLVGILCALFFAWMAAEIFRKGREHRRRKHFVICGICDHVFEDPSTHDLAECPRCGAMNERERIIEI
jgi:rubrerythrin